MFTRILLIMTVLSAGAHGQAIAGKVTDADGEPIVGARVDVWSAKPRVGPQYLCPTCFLDCARETETDAEGEFLIDHLDESLVFRFLVMRPGYRPIFYENLRTGDTNCHFVLPEFNPDEIDMAQTLQVRVTDEAGAPVAGAYAEVAAFREEDRTTFGGVTKMAVSDEDGLMLFTELKPEPTYDITIAHPDFAAHYARELPCGKESAVTLTKGASISGKITAPSSEGAAVGAGIIVGLIGDRGADGFLPVQYAYSDENGYYSFPHVTADRWYDFFVVANATDSQAGFNAPPRRIGPFKEGQSVSTMHFALKPGLSLSGTVSLPDGGTFPEGARVTASIENSWDSVTGLIAPDGAYELNGLPESEVSIFVRVEGYIPAAVEKDQWGLVDPIMLTLSEPATTLDIPLKVDAVETE